MVISFGFREICEDADEKFCSVVWRGEESEQTRDCKANENEDAVLEV